MADDMSTVVLSPDDELAEAVGEFVRDLTGYHILTNGREAREYLIPELEARGLTVCRKGLETMLREQSRVATEVLASGKNPMVLAWHEGARHAIDGILTWLADDGR